MYQPRRLVGARTSGHENGPHLLKRKQRCWPGSETKGDESEVAIEYLIAEAQVPFYGQPDTKLPIPDFFAEPISALFSRPYWKRVWVIQEVSKGREVYVICGRRSVNGNYFSRASYRFRFTNDKEVSALEYFGTAQESKYRPTLTQALSQSKVFVATDSRDKIYGILGLTSDGSDLVPAPNYLQPTASVYFQLLENLLSEQRDLNYLFRSHEPSNTGVFPAAVEPEWSNLEIGISTWILSTVGSPSSRLGFPIFF